MALLLAALGLARPAAALTIIPTFDSSITGATNAAAIEAAINGAIHVLQSNIVDNVTVNVTFVSDESVGLGQSSTFGDNYAYSNFLASLKSHATSTRDMVAMSLLPNSTNDPVIGGSQVHLTTAQERVLGLDNTYTGVDSTISCKMSLVNFTRPPGDPTKYDLQQVEEHELDEVLGISSGLPGTNMIWPADLFRYTTNLVRTFTTNGDNAYFSTDGTNLIARYNMNSGGDYGDWWSYFYPTNWSPTSGLTQSNPQVQDAFSGPGNALDLGPSELAILDVVGWTLASSPTTPSTALTIVRNGANQFTIAWPITLTGYVLQERTNLTAGAWVNSSSGFANPAILTSTASQKFYRLYMPLILGQSPAPTVAVAPVPHGPRTITTRVYQPSQP